MGQEVAGNPEAVGRGVTRLQRRNHEVDAGRFLAKRPLQDVDGQAEAVRGLDEPANAAWVRDFSHSRDGT